MIPDITLAPWGRGRVPACSRSSGPTHPIIFRKTRSAPTYLLGGGAQHAARGREPVRGSNSGSIRCRSTRRRRKARLEEEFGADWFVFDLIDQNKDFMQALNTEKLVLALAVGLIVVVAALNIISMLILMVADKTKEIGTLTALWARRPRASRASSCCRAWRSVSVGADHGAGSGLDARHSLFDRYELFKLDPDVYYLTHLPFSPHVSDLVWIGLATMLISFLATCTRRSRRPRSIRWRRFAMSEPLLAAAAVSRSFRSGPRRIEVLTNLDLEIASGESVAIVGDSGVGKSTLLHLLGGLDRPDSGYVDVSRRRRCPGTTPRRWVVTATGTIGFVFQFHHLLPEFTALENVEMPFRIGGSL